MTIKWTNYTDFPDWKVLEKEERIRRVFDFIGHLDIRHALFELEDMCTFEAVQKCASIRLMISHFWKTLPIKEIYILTPNVLLINERKSSHLWPHFLQLRKESIQVCTRFELCDTSAAVASALSVELTSQLDRAGRRVGSVKCINPFWLSFCKCKSCIFRWSPFFSIFPQKKETLHFRIRKCDGVRKTFVKLQNTGLLIFFGKIILKPL